MACACNASAGRGAALHGSPKQVSMDMNMVAITLIGRSCWQSCSKVCREGFHKLSALRRCGEAQL